MNNVCYNSARNQDSNFVQIIGEQYMSDPNSRSKNTFSFLTDDENFDSLEDHMSEESNLEDEQTYPEDDPWAMEMKMRQKYDRSDKYSLWD